MRKLKASGPVLFLLAGEVAGLVALHRLGAEPFLQVPWSDIEAWLRSADPADALAATLRLAALGTAWWLTATTILAVAVRAVGGSRSILDRLTLPFIRRMADRLGGVAVTAALLTSPGGAAWTAMQPTSAVAQATEQGWDVPGLPPMPVWPQPVPAAPQPGQPLVPADPETTTVVLVQGDNLWAVAARHLATATARDPAAVPDREVAAYWRTVIAANRERLRSGDPDLVYPGETITLPDPTHAR
jgi:nucleoid-associated protein YgaU